MARDEIIGEHAHRAAQEFIERGDLEINVHPGLRGEDLAEDFERAMIAEVVEVAVAAQEHVKLQVVVGLVAAGRA